MVNKSFTKIDPFDRYPNDFAMVKIRTLHKANRFCIPLVFVLTRFCCIYDMIYLYSTYCCLLILGSDLITYMH